MNAEPWLTILGIGEDGVDGLSPAARTLLSGASLVVGGERHLALAAELIRGDRLAWPRPFADGLAALLARRPQPTLVLASGDPFWFGVGSAVARLLPPSEYACLPSVSSFSLACARLGWSLQEVTTLSLCGRPLAALLPALQPNARLLVLSADAATPVAVGDLLRTHGFGASRLHALQALGGPRERIATWRAEQDPPFAIDALNLLAVEVVAGEGARIVPLSSGLEDSLFEHDGQLTRREIRALTLSSLAPRGGELLWDVGCGSGSVGIEWMLRHPANRAVAVERDPARAARAARNALSLGVPGLDLRCGEAPAILRDLPVPDAVFIGGGATVPGVIETARDALHPGGRLVVNAVTIECEAVLLAAQAAHGGSLTRIGIDRLDRIGGLHALRPAMRITQWCWTR
jgi:precorrin-6B C5,15-methyltransferase / cobalt-precorrin-6B C5,C15-methyltransferase